MQRFLTAAIFGVAMLTGAGIAEQAYAAPTGAPTAHAQPYGSAHALPVHYDRYDRYRGYRAPPPPRHWHRPYHRSHGYEYGYGRTWR